MLVMNDTLYAVHDRSSTHFHGWHAQLALGCRLLVDGMGSFSPIAAQARRGRKPDSVVMLVGSCATGLPPCTSADLLYSFTPIDRCAALAGRTCDLVLKVPGMRC